MIYYNHAPTLTLTCKDHQLELYSDRVIVRPTGWLARSVPVLFGGPQMLYLDEIVDVALSPVHFEPELRFQIIITGRHQAELCIDIAEAEYFGANALIDRLEYFMEQGAFLPPVG
jgi:hypothetical protein